jgi:4-amino-4-deoxy-L-arabinose transferase-like glycosyltransferase
MEFLLDAIKHPFGARTILFLLLAVGLVLRLPGLDRDLWYDEALSFFDARGTDAVVTKIIPNGPEFTSDMFAQDGGWRGTLQAVSRTEWTPPLYFLLLRLWVKLFGERDLILRLLSVILAVATIPAIFLLGRRVFDEKTGLAAAAVLALLPSHIQFSQEVRAYALAVLLTTLASWAFWSAYQVVGQPKERRYWLLYVGLAAASLYTHYLTAGIFIAHGLFALIQPGGLRLPLVKRLILVAVVIALVFTPWLFYQIPNQLYMMSLQAKFDPTLRPEGFWGPETLKRIAALACYLVAGCLPGMKFKSPLGIILLIVYAVGLLAALSVARSRGKRPEVLLSFLSLVLPVLLMIAEEAVRGEAILLMTPKYALVAVIGFCLLLGATVAFSRHRGAPILLTVLVTVTTIHFHIQWHRVNTSPSPLAGAPWFYGSVPSAVARVSQQAKPDELILFDAVDLPPVWSVYQRAPVPQLLMTSKSFAYNAPRDFESRWNEAERKYAGVYLVRRAEELPGEVMRRLEAHYQRASLERIGRLEIRHYVK